MFLFKKYKLDILLICVYNFKILIRKWSEYDLVLINLLYLCVVIKVKLLILFNMIIFLIRI